MPALDAGTDKLIVTHGSALRAKYGSPGVALIRAALRTLVRLDRARGIVTTVVDVSSRAAMKPTGLRPIADSDDHQQFRTALDALCDLATPDYVLLLGGPDIVPLVPLVNPMPAPDPDPDLPSDLPYACPGSSGLEPLALVGPTRVVGRLPEVPHASGTEAGQAFAAVIREAARWSAVPRTASLDPLCLSTARWQLSTAATLRTMLDSAPAPMAPQLAPPRSAPWAAAELARPLQLVNLHGATADPSWLGDPGFAPALSSADLANAQQLRTVVLAECCFAAELWEPALAGGTMPLPLAYLAGGAYGLVGPTCISYGGRTSPDAADVLVRMVGEELLAGASLGRAVLAARQRYVAEQPVMTPVDLKTLAQFSLVGDPSIQPVETPVPGTRAGRRARLTRVGLRLARTTPVAAVAAEPVARGATRAFAVVSPPAAAAPPSTVRVQVTVRRRPRSAGLRVIEQHEDTAGVIASRELESR
jgi:Peptidase family C25